MSNLTQEIIALEQNRQSIVDAVNAKGGELAESAPLNAIAQAIEALPSGTVAVLEGEITPTSAHHNMRITHNLGKVPFMAVAEFVGESEPISQKVFYVKCFNDPKGGWYKQYNASLVVSISGFGDNPTLLFNEDYVQLFTDSTSRTFYTAPYKFKIYYEI